MSVLEFAISSPFRPAMDLPGSDAYLMKTRHALRHRDGRDCMSISILPSPLITGWAHPRPILGALSLKGDYPHPMAHLLAVYASSASLPNRRKTRYGAAFQGLTPVGLPSRETRAPTGKRQLRLAHGDVQSSALRWYVSRPIA